MKNSIIYLTILMLGMTASAYATPFPLNPVWFTCDNGMIQVGKGNHDLADARITDQNIISGIQEAEVDYIHNNPRSSTLDPQGLHGSFQFSSDQGKPLLDYLADEYTWTDTQNDHYDNKPFNLDKFNMFSEVGGPDNVNPFDKSSLYISVDPTTGVRTLTFTASAINVVYYDNGPHNQHVILRKFTFTDCK